MELRERVERHAKRVRPMSQGSQVDALPDGSEDSQVIRPGAVKLAEHDLPGCIGDAGCVTDGCELGESLGAVPGERELGSIAAQYPIAVRQHDGPLIVDELVIPPGVPVDLQVGTFGDALRVTHGPVRLRVSDLTVGGHLARWRGVRCVPEYQLVLHADEEHGAARVALAAGPAAQLIVEAAARMPSGPDDEQPAEASYLVAVASLAPKANVGSASGHLRRHGDRAVAASLRHDGGLLRAVLGLEHRAGQPCCPEHAVQPFRLGNVQGPNQHRPSGGVRRGDLAEYRLLLLADRGVEAIGLILAYARPVRRDHGHLKRVEGPQLIPDSDRGAGHAAYLRITPDQGLDGDAVQSLAALAGGQALLRLDRRLQPVWPALQPGDPAA